MLLSNFKFVFDFLDFSKRNNSPSSTSITISNSSSTLVESQTIQTSNCFSPSIHFNVTSPCHHQNLTFSLSATPCHTPTDQHTIDLDSTRKTKLPWTLSSSPSSSSLSSSSATTRIISPTSKSFTPLTASSRQFITGPRPPPSLYPIFPQEPEWITPTTWRSSAALSCSRPFSVDPSVTSTSVKHNPTTNEVITKKFTTQKVTSHKVTTSKTTFTPQATSTATIRKPLRNGYYTPWSLVTPQDLDYNNLDLIHFAFAIPDKRCDQSVKFQDEDGKKLIKVISLAHEKGKKVVISVGGWDESQCFSKNVGTKANRKRFSKNLVNLMKRYNADGLDLDWEYPGREGKEGDDWNSKDSDNFLLLLKQLRGMIGKDKLLIACTTNQPFYGSNHKPLKDMSGFGNVLDYLLVMNYDVWGATLPARSNSPFNNTCQSSNLPKENMVDAIEGLEKIKFPKSKILMGVPFYGWVVDSSAESLSHERRKSFEKMKRFKSLNLDRDFFKDFNNSSSIGLRVRADNDEMKKKKTEHSRVSDYFGAQISFSDLVALGALKKKKGTSRTFIGGNGFVRKWDKCSSTPYLVDSKRKVIISYEDPQSLSIKSAYALKVGIGGIGPWQLSQDWNGVLLAGLRHGMGS